MQQHHPHRPEGDGSVHAQERVVTGLQLSSRRHRSLRAHPRHRNAGGFNGKFDGCTPVFPGGEGDDKGTVESVYGGKMSNNPQFYTHTSVAVQPELIRVNPRNP